VTDQPTSDAAVGAEAAAGPAVALQAAAPVPPPPTFETIEEVAAVVVPLMRAVGESAGPNCELVLHDLSSRQLEASVYAIYNGVVSGRGVGSPSTSLGLAALRDEAADHDDFGYISHTSVGRELRSSSTYFRNARGQIIAAFCVNYDLSPLQQAADGLAAILAKSLGKPRGELLAPDISDVLGELIAEALATVGKPAHRLEKKERLLVMGLLERRGAFNVSRSVDIVAKRLGVSKVTAYGYLAEIRRQEAVN
jgi:predicted transcriptional regulator YheO